MDNLIHMANKKRYISNSTRYVAINLDRMVVVDKKLQNTNLHVPWNTWSREVLWQIKNVIFPLPRGLWPLKLTGWCLLRRSHHPQWPHDTIVTWSINNVVSPFIQGSWLPNSTRLMILGHHAQNPMIFWSRDHM